MHRKNEKKNTQKKSDPFSFSVLQQGLTGERALIGEKYMDNPALLAVYSDYYWPVSREQARHILAQISRVRPWGFDAVLDAGSGPAPVSSAFLEQGALSVSLVDQSERALTLAKKLLAKAEGVLTLKADISRPETVRVGLNRWGSFDCVAFGHSLNELWAGIGDRIEKRIALLESYTGALGNGGLILVIEPALLSTSRDLLAVRDGLVSRGWRVLSPCPGRADLPCPAFEAGPQHTCHDEALWKMPPKVASLADSLKVDKESLKMTWFLFEPPVRGVHVPAAGDDRDANGDTNDDADLYRVVSDPMVNKSGRIRRLLCGKKGRIALSAPGDSFLSETSGFSSLRRGDLVRLVKPEARENGWGIAEDTRIIKI